MCTNYVCAYSTLNPTIRRSWFSAKAPEYIRMIKNKLIAQVQYSLHNAISVNCITTEAEYLRCDRIRLWCLPLYRALLPTLYIHPLIHHLRWRQPDWKHQLHAIYHQDPAWPSVSSLVSCGGSVSRDMTVHSAECVVQKARGSRHRGPFSHRRARLRALLCWWSHRHRDYRGAGATRGLR